MVPGTSSIASLFFGPILCKSACDRPLYASETTKKAQPHRLTLAWAMSDCALRRRLYRVFTGTSARTRGTVSCMPEPDLQ